MKGLSCQWYALATTHREWNQQVYPSVRQPDNNHVAPNIINKKDGKGPVVLNYGCYSNHIAHEQTG